MHPPFGNAQKLNEGDDESMMWRRNYQIEIQTCDRVYIYMYIIVGTLMMSKYTNSRISELIGRCED